MSGDGARVAYPLFQEEDGGAIPTSPLQLEICQCSVELAVSLNKQWHSRLPKITNPYGDEICFVAQYQGKLYASAIWTMPVARLFNGKNYLELRRMAISANAPKNTASRMIAVMTKIIRKAKPHIIKLISYQDTEVHSGTIYKASGWVMCGYRKGGKDAWSCNVRKRRKCQAIGDKIRWEKDL